MPQINSSELVFRPTYGVEEKILDSDVDSGRIYFATDTGRVYLDTYYGERMSVGGGGTAVLYSADSNISHNVDDTYSIHSNALSDQNYTPRANDLIINKDGRFFKVKSYTFGAEFIICTLIAVSGTGGGGGGSSPSNPSDPKRIDVVYEDYRPTFIAGQPYSITLKATSQVDTFLNLTYEVFNAQGKVGEGSYQITSGATISLPVSKYIAADGSNHMVTIKITGAMSTPFSQDLTQIKCYNLSVKTNFNNFEPASKKTGVFNYSMIFTGEVEKDLYLTVDDINIFAPAAYQTLSKEITEKSVSINCQDLGLLSGVHTIKAWVETGGISSEIEELDFIYKDPDDEDNTYIIITSAPKRCLSYQTPSIYFWVCNTAQNTGINQVRLSVNGVLGEYAPYNQADGNILEISVPNLLPNSNNICQLVTDTGATSKEIIIYCEYSDIFDEHKDGDVLLLNAEGRSNNASTEIKQKWEYTNSRKKKISANLLDFNWYNNGWIKDENDKFCLRISNGAKVEIPLNLFNNSAYGNGGFTLEFEFKPYNLYSQKLLNTSTVTTEKDNSDDDEVEIERKFNTDLAVISYLDSNNEYGFCCGTQDAFFSVGNKQNCIARYTHNNPINIALTINTTTKQMILYVNGVMSGMSTYPSNDDLPKSASKIIINSEQCDVDLYSIRIYDNCLTSVNIVKNYIASKKDLQLYTENAFATSNTVDLKKVIEYNKENPSNVTIPYIIFKTKGKPDVLPFNKDNKDINCDITFVNPTADKMLNFNEISEDEYIKQAPSFFAQDVPINVQGTSSQKYPRKNFKGKFKKAKSWTYTNSKITKYSTLTDFYINPSIKEKTFTWKADYMDSSSCHNTGFANFAYELYDKHPLDYIINPNGDDYHKKYRTTLYGFKVMAFHEKSDGTTEFIGIYNFNLDKSAPKVLGMELEEEHPYLQGTYYDEESGTDKPLDIAHICECWEMANNLGGRTAFREPAFDNNYDYNTKEYYKLDEDGNMTSTLFVPDIGEDLEVRYHWNKDRIEGAWEKNTVPLKDGGVPITAEEAFNVLLGGTSYENRTGAYKNLERFFKWIQSCYYAFDLSPTGGDIPLIEEMLGRPLIYDENGILNDPEFEAKVEERKDEFENNFNKHLNYDYCMIYYIVTEVFLQFDSRGKNMMFASWGPKEEGGEYIWFPIYYDVDTQLGVNNSGVPSWEYNVEPTTGFNNNNIKAFSTAYSLLWRNFHQSYVVDDPFQVINYYRTIRENLGKANRYFNSTLENGDLCMRGILPINVFNANQYYKYIQPSLNSAVGGGYVIGVNEDTLTPIYRTTSAYFYCLQGDRLLHRAQFLNNRFNYYDSKWQAGEYNPLVNSSPLTWRAMYTILDDTDDGKLLPNFNIKVKPMLDQYILVWPDNSQGRAESVFTNGGTFSKNIDLSVFMKPGVNEQLVYIGGSNQIQELGNVSLLYPMQFEYSPITTAIEMGNSNDKYDNPKLNIEQMNQALLGKPLLKKLDLTNLSKVTSISLTGRPEEGQEGSLKIEECKLLGTKINKIDFLEGVNIKKLYAPKTFEQISLIEAKNLKEIVYNKNEIYDSDGTERDVMYIDELIHLQDKSEEKTQTNINSINIIGGSLKQYSYELLKKITLAKQDMISSKVGNQILDINLQKVQWSPYVLMGEGAEYKESEKDLYVMKTDYYSFIPYVFIDEATWQQDILNEKLYKKDVDFNKTCETDLSLLQTYISDIVTFPELSNRHFINSKHSLKYPVIEGEMYIDNNVAINETELSSIHKNYFPNLHLKVKNVLQANRIKFVYQLDEDSKEMEIDTLRFNKSDETIEINIPSFEIPEHYEFDHWELNGIEITEEEIKNLKFSNIISEYKIKAILKLMEYNVTFYLEQWIGGAWKYITKDDWVVKATIKDIIQEPFYPYKAAIDLPGLTDCYTFIGYSTKETVDNIVNLNNLRVTEDISLYAKFKGNGNVYKNVLSEDYLIIDKYGYISQNPNKKLIQGKITLPLVVNSKPVLGIADNGFKDNKEITHIFWEQPSLKKEQKVESIGDASFYGCINLICFEIIDSLESIGQEAFKNIRKLKLYNRSIDTLNSNFIIRGQNLTTLKVDAFRGAFSDSLTDGGVLVIGGKVRNLGQGSIGYNFNSKKNMKIKFGDYSLPSPDWWSDSIETSDVIYLHCLDHYTGANYELTIEVSAQNPTYDPDAFESKLDSRNNNDASITTTIVTSASGDNKIEENNN